MAFHPGQPMFDTGGAQIDAHGGGFLLDDRTYYWYGSSRIGHPDPPGPDRGINLYSSTDLYSWRFESLVVPMRNASGTTEPVNTYERPKVVQCAGRYVMWLRGTWDCGGTLLKVAVLTSQTPLGPFEWVVDRPGDDPFQALAGQYQYGDATLWSDPATGHTYVYWRARTPGVGFRAMRLNDDCTDVVRGSDTRLFSSPNREAPAFFSVGSHYYLWTSGTNGWNPQQAYVYRGPTPLGPFNQSLGHGWHAYRKLADFNTTHTFSVRDGYLPVGHDWVTKRSTTVATAEALCAGAARCRGFTFKSHDRRPAQAVSISFKTSNAFVPEGDPEGIQPPPIPEPGTPGNRKEDGEPGEWSYGSQSTFILPNPRWSPGSSRPPFVYMADRWQPSTPDFGVYVWLPLFVDPERPDRVSVVWRDHWSLDDNFSSPFVRK